MARSEKIRRKDLLQPDEFLTLSRRALAFAEENRAALLIAVGAVAVVLVALVAYRSISASREARAGEAYARAHRMLADKKYDEAAAAFQSLVDGYAGTTYGPLARLEAGDALLLGGHSEEAASAFQAFLDAGPPVDYLRQLALTRLAYAHEQAGKNTEARKAFASAAAEPGPLGDDALLGEARIALDAGDTAHARQVLEQFLDKFPTSDRRPQVTSQLVKLGWKPPASPDDATRATAASDG